MWTFRGYLKLGQETTFSFSSERLYQSFFKKKWPEVTENSRMLKLKQLTFKMEKLYCEVATDGSGLKKHTVLFFSSVLAPEVKFHLEKKG